MLSHAIYFQLLLALSTYQFINLLTKNPKTMIRICTYNIEWFNDIFNADNTLKQFNTAVKKEKELDEKRQAVITVLQTVLPDIVGIVEAPNTTTTSGAQDCAIKLKNFMNSFGWTNYEVCMGYISRGQQELAIIYNADKVTVTHVPGGDPKTKSNPPFDAELYFDTDDDDIEEVYTMYRPPLEAEVVVKATGEKFRVMVVHAKSKAIFSATDRVHFDRMSTTNRRKLYAECAWIRKRVEEWQTVGHRVIVLGDMNDGPGMDYYEATFGKSAVELIMGDIFDRERILIHHGGRPKWGPYGWEPSSTNFTDPFTNRKVNAQIDHILSAASIPIINKSYRIWNPNELNDAKAISAQLKNASDHYPVTLDLDL
jgi:endonuclease/exonuclease/phosphatase family metal-dependent hydrolase